MQLNLDNSKYYNELVSYFWESFESLFYWNQSGAGAGAAVRPLAGTAQTSGCSATLGQRICIFWLW